MQQDARVIATATLSMSWTIEELDKYFIETGLAEGVPEGLEGGAPGQVIEIWAQIINDIEVNEGRCAGFRIENHIFLYRYAGSTIFITVKNRFKPDPTNVPGAFVDAEGWTVLKSPALIGATPLVGCFLRYEYDIVSKKLMYRPYVLDNSDNIDSQ